MQGILRRTLVVAASAVIATGTVTAASTADSIPTAHNTTTLNSVGALFFPSVFGLLPALGGPHFCSASVVHSTTRDLVLTAAHCVYGTGFTIEFAPGFHDGKSPFGVWAVRRVYVPAAWKASQDPKSDVAILQMATHGGRHIEDVVGAHPLGVPSVGAQVTVDGYPAGSGGEAITCTNTLYDTDGYSSFNCHGYVDGVSGGPWYVGARVVGVTGGLHQGGCTEATSYSAPFGAGTAALLQRAEAGGSSDFAPAAGSDGC